MKHTINIGILSDSKLIYMHSFYGLHPCRSMYKFNSVEARAIGHMLIEAAEYLSPLESREFEVRPIEIH